MTIDLDQLERAIIILLAEMRTFYADQVEIDFDYYWYVDSPDWISFEESPGEPSVGQISHDWERISELVNDPSLITPFGLVWVAAILRALGEGPVRSAV